MANANRGEISADLDGKSWNLCLTLGALASLETKLEAQNLSELTQKFSKGQFSSDEIIKILHAAIIGGGHEITEAEVANLQVEGGIGGYVKIVARLFEVTFMPLENEE